MRRSSQKPPHTYARDRSRKAVPMAPSEPKQSTIKIKSSGTSYEEFKRQHREKHDPAYQKSKKDLEMSNFFKSASAKMSLADDDLENVDDSIQDIESLNPNGNSSAGDSGSGTSSRDAIKVGISKGYAQKIDTSWLQSFTRENIPFLNRILHGKQASSFVDDAKTKILDTKSEWIGQQTVIASGWIPGSGYYGNKGWEIVSLVIQETMGDEVNKAMKNSSWMSKLSRPMSLVDLTLVPEMLVKIYMHEQDIDREEAIVLLDEAHQYGQQMFRDVVENSDSEDSDIDDSKKRKKRNIKHEQSSPKRKQSKMEKVLNVSLDDDDDDQENESTERPNSSSMKTKLFDLDTSVDNEDDSDDEFKSLNDFLDG